MTAKAALAKALLDGHVLTVMNCFKMIGLTNIAREIPRMIERPFDVEVSRTHKVSTSRYGQTVHFVQYRLNTSDHNKPGIEKMKEYLRQNSETEKVTKAVSGIPQEKLF